MVGRRSRQLSKGNKQSFSMLSTVLGLCRIVSSTYSTISLAPDFLLRGGNSPVMLKNSTEYVNTCLLSLFLFSRTILSDSLVSPTYACKNRLGKRKITRTESSFIRNKQFAYMPYNTINVQVYKHVNMNSDAEGRGDFQCRLGIHVPLPTGNICTTWVS